MRTLLLAGLTVTPVPFARGTRARVWLRSVRVGPPSGPAVPRPWGGAVCRRFGRPRPEQGSAVSRAPGAGSLGWHSCSARGVGYPPVPRVHTGSPVEPRARGQTAGGDRAGSPASWAPPVGALWVLCPSDRVLQAVRRQVSWCVDRHRWPAARADTQTVLSLASQPKPSVGLPHAARHFCRDCHRPQAVRRVRRSAPRDTVSGRGRGRSCRLFKGAARGLDENLAKHVRTFH